MFRGTENGFDKATKELKGNASNIILDSVCEADTSGTIIPDRYTLVQRRCISATCSEIAYLSQQVTCHTIR